MTVSIEERALQTLKRASPGDCSLRKDSPVSSELALIAQHVL